MAHKIKQSPEPLEYDILSSPWCSITLDNFEFKGMIYLIIYDRFSRFMVIKNHKDLSVRSTIQSLLEVFCEHEVPSSITSDWGHNFISKEFHIFCTDLGIDLSYSSWYHQSLNQAEHAICTVKDLMKRCYSASVHWRIALLEYLCTPGPDRQSPSQLMCRQFRGIMPMVTCSTNCQSDTDLLPERWKEKREI